MTKSRMNVPTPKLYAIIQARLGSNRLPGKSMMDLGGKPMLWHVIQRVKMAIPDVIVATPDLEIAEYTMREGVHAYIGSEDDVLDRYYQSAKKYNASPIVRITADCPFIDPKIIRLVVNYYYGYQYDYVSNRTYPLGLSVEVFSFDALKTAWKTAIDPYDREHVTPFIYHNPDLFRIGNIGLTADLSHISFTVDTQRDMDYVRGVYSNLCEQGKGVSFSLDDLLREYYGKVYV